MPRQDPDEGLFDGFQVLEGEFRVGELIVLEFGHDQLLDEFLYAGRGGLFQGPHRRLGYVRQHDHRGLPRTGRDAGVGEVFGIHLGFPFERGVVEPTDHRIAVVLVDDVDHRLGEAQAPGLLHPQLDVAADHRGGKPGVDVVVLVVSALVLHKVAGLLHLADVVVVGPHPGQHGVGPDLLAGGLRQVCHHDRMAVGSGGRVEKPLEDRGVEVGEFDKPEGGNRVQGVFQEGEDSQDQHPRSQAVKDRPEKHHRVAREGTAEDQQHGQGRHAVGPADDQSRPDHIHPLLGPLEREGRHQAGSQGEDIGGHLKEARQKHDERQDQGDSRSQGGPQ